jgi:glycosyltransferase involved in cell wall biosynthesis
MCWNQGDWRFYYYYRRWQKSAYQKALELMERERYDVVHHLNMTGYREPGYLWRLTGVPFVWGPIGGFASVPLRFLPALGLRNALFYSIKNFLNFMQARGSIRVRRAIARASGVLASSTDSKIALERIFGKKAIVMNETGCRVSHSVEERLHDADFFHVLWVGRFIPTKMLNLALKTIGQVKDLQGLRFHIVGDGVDGRAMLESKRLASELGISDICVWHGRVSHSRVQELMQTSDLLFFSSLIEGTSHVVLEAIANSLPVLCFDVCGHGEVINDAVGRKVPALSPAKSVELFSKNIRELFYDRNKLDEMSGNCLARMEELSWAAKADQMVATYSQVISRGKRLV